MPSRSNQALFGLFCLFFFITTEALQYVYFGAVFQRVNPFLLGLLVFGIAAPAFIAWSAWRDPAALKAAWSDKRNLIAVNVTCALAFSCFMASVQLIEPAVAYTVGAGVMPLTAYAAQRFGVPEGDDLRNRLEVYGNLIIVLGLVLLAVVTVMGLAGFVWGDSSAVAALGIFLAAADGILFTWVIIYSRRLDCAGVGPSAVFGLRFPLYMLGAGAAVALGVGVPAGPPPEDLPMIVFLALLLVVPPLFALQLAVGKVSALTIGAVTALGPFFVFTLQAIEGRVNYSTATLIGLFVYFAGAMLAAWGAVKATR